MNALTLADTLTLVRKLRSVAASGGTVDFYPYYSLACACELAIEKELQPLNVPIQEAA